MILNSKMVPILLSFTILNFPYFPHVNSHYLESWRSLEKFSRSWIMDWAHEQETRYGHILNTTKLSHECRNSLLQYVENLKNLDLDAVRRLDASGKLPSGIFQGSWTDLGSFDQCLSVPESQYCLTFSRIPLRPARRFEGFFRPYDSINYNLSDPTFSYIGQSLHLFRYLNITIGLCLSKSCSTKEIRSLAQDVSNFQNIGLEIDVDLCQARTFDPWQTRELIALVIICTVLGLNLLGAIFSKACFLRHFNPWTNLKKVLTPPGKEFPFLNGIKALNMVYLILGHCMAGQMMNTFDRLFAARDTFAPIGLSVFLSPNTVETFYAITGLEMMNFFLIFGKGFKLLPFLALRWARFAIIIGWMICVNILVFSDHSRVLFGGPFWHNFLAAGSIPEMCQKNWLRHVLLIAHYFDSIDDWRTCLMADWYLECDFIYAILFLLVLYPYRSGKTVTGIVTAIFMIVVSTLTLGFIVWMFQVQTSWRLMDFLTVDMAKLFIYVQTKPWTHTGSYFIGVILAFLLALPSTRSKLPKEYTPIGWITSIILVGILFSFELALATNESRINYGIQLVYSVTHRMVWCIIIAWIVYSCHSHRIWHCLNRFLSSNVFGVLARVNLNLMFTNILVIRLHNATIRTTITPSLMSFLFGILIPILLQSYFLAFLFALLIDKPASALASCLILRETIKPQPNNNYITDVEDLPRASQNQA